MRAFGCPICGKSHSGWEHPGAKVESGFSDTNRERYPKDSRASILNTKYFYLTSGGWNTSGEEIVVDNYDKWINGWFYPFTEPKLKKKAPAKKKKSPPDPVVLRGTFHKLLLNYRRNKVMENLHLAFHQYNEELRICIEQNGENWKQIQRKLTNIKYLCRTLALPMPDPADGYILGIVNG